MSMLAQSHVPVSRSELPWALRIGALCGFLAGIVFAAFELVAAEVMMGSDAFFMPLRMMGAILLGRDALDPSYSLLAAASAGVIVHLVLSIIYGIVFAVVLGGFRPAAWDAVIGAAYGLALWIINFYLIAPWAFPWFGEANPMIQFIAHTFFFGAILGTLVWWSRERTA
jgi:uncharacterized membrane protein YagU involved in acid resistance